MDLKLRRVQRTEVVFQQQLSFFWKSTYFMTTPIKQQLSSLKARFYLYHFTVSFSDKNINQEKEATNLYRKKIRTSFYAIQKGLDNLNKVFRLSRHYVITISVFIVTRMDIARLDTFTFTSELSLIFLKGKLMKALRLEVLERSMKICWWNFEMIQVSRACPLITVNNREGRGSEIKA